MADDTPTKPWRLEGAALAGLRKAWDLKARELARRAGISADLLSQYETGIKAPSAEQLDRLLEPLACSPEEFRELAAELERLTGTGVARERVAFVELAPEDRRQVRRAGRVLQRLGEEELERWALEREVRRARRRASVRVRRLLGYPRREWPVLVAHADEYHDWAVVEALCRRSQEAASDSADRALELAELGLRAAERVEPKGPLRARVCGFALAYVGNARRVRNDLDGARAAFAKALRLWGEGASVDPYPLEGWQIFNLEASLRIDVQELDRALECLDAALAEAARSSAVGALLLKKARVLEQRRDFEAALAALEEAEPWLKVERLPRHVFGLQFNRAVNLCHLGRFATAELLLPEVRARAIELRTELDLIRTLWLEARVAIGLERMETGVASLEQVAEEFRARDLAYDGALVHLDLAVVELEQGKTAAVQQRAADMWWIFRAGQLHREAVAALDLFCQAARREAATVELARRVQDYLKRAERNPALLFDD